MKAQTPHIFIMWSHASLCLGSALNRLFQIQTPILIQAAKHTKLLFDQMDFSFRYLLLCLSPLLLLFLPQIPFSHVSLTHRLLQFDLGEVEKCDDTGRNETRASGISVHADRLLLVVKGRITLKHICHRVCSVCIEYYFMQ